jgi:hypothetical protein
MFVIKQTNENVSNQKIMDETIDSPNTNTIGRGV